MHLDMSVEQRGVGHPDAGLCEPVAVPREDLGWWAVGQHVGVGFEHHDSVDHRQSFSHPVFDQNGGRAGLSLDGRECFSNQSCAGGIEVRSGLVEEQQPW